jgi:hypothetical protein
MAGPKSGQVILRAQRLAINRNICCPSVGASLSTVLLQNRIEPYPSGLTLTT